MKKLGLFAAAVLVAASVFAEMRSDVVKMTNGTMTVTLDSQFSPPRKLDSIYLVYPSASTTNAYSMTYSSRGNGAAVELYSGAFTNVSTLFKSAVDLTVYTGDRFVFTNSVSNGWLVLNYKME
jgi:hypothetical protein